MRSAIGDGRRHDLRRRRAGRLDAGARDPDGPPARRRGRLFWLEDPLVEQDLDGYRQLRAAVTTRICTGEKGWTGDHFGRLIDSGALDVIMIDPGKAEGVTGTWNVIRAAAAAGRDWNAHSWSSALNTAASLHLATASDNVLVMELKPLPSPMQHELVTNPIDQHDGWVIRAQTGPALASRSTRPSCAQYLFD